MLADMTPILKLNQGSFHVMSISDCILQDVLMPSSAQASGFRRKPSSVNVQRGGRSTSTLLIASLMLSVSTSATDVAPAMHFAAPSSSIVVIPD
jgi:hypothetical protein